MRSLHFGILGGLAVVLVIVFVAMSSLSKGDGVAAPTPSLGASESAGPVETPHAEQTAAPTPSEVALTVITAANSSEFAAMPKLGNNCSPAIAAFTAAHTDDTIGAMGSQTGARTRYDIVLDAGDFSETTAAGPAFQYRDVSSKCNLRWTSTNPDTALVWDQLHLVAESGRYETGTCLFHLNRFEASAHWPSCSSHAGVAQAMAPAGHTPQYSRLANRAQAVRGIV